MGSLSYGGNAHSALGKVKVDPRLLDVVTTAAAASPYNVRIISEVRGKGATAKGNHDNGYAIDVQLQDPRTGEWLPNKGMSPGGASAYPVYESFAQLARVVQQQRYPELNSTLRWGGGFHQGGTPFDMMHFDITPRAHGAMAYYDWDTGITDAGRKALPSAKSNGGLSNGRVVAQLNQQLEGGAMPPGDIPDLTAEAAIGQPGDAAPIPAPLPPGLRDLYLTGDAGLGYTSPPQPSPALGAIASGARPALPTGYGSSGLTEGQRNAMLALPSLPPAPVPTITTANQAADFYQGFGLPAPSTRTSVPPLPSVPPSLIRDTFANLPTPLPSPPALPPAVPQGFDPTSAGRMIGNTFASLPPAPSSSGGVHVPLQLLGPDQAAQQVAAQIASMSPSDNMPDGITRTTGGIAGTVQLPPDERPGDGGWGQYPPTPTLPGETSIASTVPLSRNTSAALPPIPMDPLRGELARAFGGGQTRTYTGTGPLPDPAPFVKGGSVGFDFSLQPSSAPITGSPINGTNGFRYSPNAAGGYTRVGKIDPNLPPPLPQPLPQPPSSNGGEGIQSFAPLPPLPPILGRDITDNLMPGADLASLDVPSSVSVPRYIEVQKRVPVPSSQPIQTGDGVHWDADRAQYVLDSPAPAPAPTYRTVTEKQLNPAWVKAQQAPAPVVPLSPPPEELAALREKAENPLARLFGATPLGHVVNFAQTLGQAPHYGAPATSGLLAMLTGHGGVGGSTGGGLLGLLSGLGHNTPSAQIRSQVTPQVAALQNPLALAALNAGQGSYTAPGGGMVPTLSINGTPRNSYGDEANGIGRSLSSLI